MPPRKNTEKEFRKMKDQYLLYLLIAKMGFKDIFLFCRTLEGRTKGYEKKYDKISFTYSGLEWMNSYALKESFYCDVMSLTQCIIKLQKEKGFFNNLQQRYNKYANACLVHLNEQLESKNRASITIDEVIAMQIICDFCHQFQDAQKAKKFFGQKGILFWLNSMFNKAMFRELESVTNSDLVTVDQIANDYGDFVTAYIDGMEVYQGHLKKTGESDQSLKLKSVAKGTSEPENLKNMREKAKQDLCHISTFCDYTYMDGKILTKEQLEEGYRERFTALISKTISGEKMTSEEENEHLNIQNAFGFLMEPASDSIEQSVKKYQPCFVHEPLARIVNNVNRDPFSGRGDPGADDGLVL